MSVVTSDHRFTKPTITKVYNYTKDYAKVHNKRRKVVANLLMGEWVKILKKFGPYCYIRFRGGNGIVEEKTLSETRLLELYFIDVGQGDSILIQTPGDKRILIDGGRDNEAHSFLQWKYNLFKETNNIDFEAVVMTHADKDHAKGLNSVLRDKQIHVKAFYHMELPDLKIKRHLLEKLPDKEKTVH